MQNRTLGERVAERGNFLPDSGSDLGLGRRGKQKSAHGRVAGSRVAQKQIQILGKSRKEASRAWVVRLRSTGVGWTPYSLRVLPVRYST